MSTLSYRHCRSRSPLLASFVRPISHKRLTQQKKQRERERKELDALNRRHLANVRVVQRNVVYVVGLGSRFAKEEVCSLSLCAAFDSPRPHLFVL